MWLTGRREDINNSAPLNQQQKKLKLRKIGQENGRQIGGEISPLPVNEPVNGPAASKLMGWETGTLNSSMGLRPAIKLIG